MEEFNTPFASNYQCHIIRLTATHFLGLLNEPEHPAPGIMSPDQHIKVTVDETSPTTADHAPLAALPLSRRDQIAVAAMQGVLATKTGLNLRPEITVKYAVRFADALIEALDSSAEARDE